VSVHETARPIHLTERDCWLSECSCGWEQITRSEMEARLAWKNHKSAMDELEERIAGERGVLRLSNDRLGNEARDPDVASIEEAFLYIAPVHESVVRDAQAALRRIVEEIAKWHREALDWQQAKSEADAAWEEAHQLAHRQDETIFDLNHKLAVARDVLYQIAAPKRPDGTYNLNREACERLAVKVLEDEYGL
jgi:hypothetical protein